MYMFLNYDFLWNRTSVPDDESKFNKCKVNMICWNENDQYVIIAVNDCTLKVWDSYTGKLHKVLSVSSLPCTVHLTLLTVYGLNSPTARVTLAEFGVD